MTDYFYWEKASHGTWQPKISYNEMPVPQKGYDTSDPGNYSRTTPQPINSMLKGMLDHAALLQACVANWPAPVSKL